MVLREVNETLDYFYFLSMMTLTADFTNFCHVDSVVTLHNQYYLFNHLPIDIEVISTNRWGRWQKRTPLVVTRNEPPVPFHFDDSGFFRLRRDQPLHSFVLLRMHLINVLCFTANV